MIHTTLGVALAVAVLAGQAPGSASRSNYSGLERLKSSAPSTEASQRRPPQTRPRFGRELEAREQAIERGPCGMPVIVADASADPRIIIPIPERADDVAKIRVVEPAPCGAVLSKAGRK